MENQSHEVHTTPAGVHGHVQETAPLCCMPPALLIYKALLIYTGSIKAIYSKEIFFNLACQEL